MVGGCPAVRAIGLLGLPAVSQHHPTEHALLTLVLELRGEPVDHVPDSDVGPENEATFRRFA